MFEVLYAGSGEHEVREIDPAGVPDRRSPRRPAAGDGRPQAQAEAAAVRSRHGPRRGVPNRRHGDLDSGRPLSRRRHQRYPERCRSGRRQHQHGVRQQRRDSAASAGVLGELGYTESDISTDLSRMVSASDGFLDQIPTLRNTYGADVVTLLGEGYTSAGPAVAAT